MARGALFAAAAVVVGLLTLGHAAFTWPPSAVVAFFGGGALVAFIAEAAVVNRGWLEHHIGPKTMGVPLYTLFGWTGTMYVAFRIALLVTDGWSAVAVTGMLATTYDVLTDHHGVTAGHWTYTDDLPGPRYRAVPWWNFLGWFAISCLTSALTIQFL